MQGLSPRIAHSRTCWSRSPGGDADGDGGGTGSAGRGVAIGSGNPSVRGSGSSGLPGRHALGLRRLDDRGPFRRRRRAWRRGRGTGTNDDSHRGDEKAMHDDSLDR